MAPDVTVGGDRTSAVDLLVGQIKDLIRDRQLKVGDALPTEVEMAEMFGASRNTAREAIRVLKTYGVLESRQKVGAVLTDRRSAAMMDAFSFAIDISADAFHDIQGFRRLVEVNLADALIQAITPAQISELEHINETMKSALSSIEASRQDFQFHKYLVSVAGIRTLTEVYGMLEPVIRKLMENGKSQRRGLEGAFEEHGAIIAALKKRDRISFAYHMHRHLDAGLEFIPAASDLSGAADTRT